jgi:outer membrane protein
MKPILISALVALLGLGQTVYAQTAPGQWLAGGSLSMSGSRAGSNSAINDRSFGFSLSPRVGYFVINRLAVGIVSSVGYSSSQRDIGAGGSFTSSVNTLAASAFARYYLQSGRLVPFVQGEFGYTRFSITSRSPQFATTMSSSEDQGTYAIGVGLAYFVSPQVAIEGTVDYAARAFIPTSANHLLDFRVGLMMYFGKGK